jgi:hypothetical protein
MKEVAMAKRFLPVFLSVLFILLSCVHRAPPPKTMTEFLLMASKSQTSKPDHLEEILGKKKAVYLALKSLSSKNNIVIIYDASGSMREKIGESGLRKFEAAYEGLKQIGTLFQPSDNVRLLVFGSRKPSGITNEGIIIRKDYVRAVEASSDVELIYSSPREGFNQKDFLATIKYLGSEHTYIGDTPIGYSVLKAHQILKGTSNAKVILITDGEETGSLLAQSISKDKAWEERLRKKYPNYDEITISAFESIKKLVEDKIYFSPILYGLGGSMGEKSARDKEIQSIRNFYQKLATQSGSIYLEAVTSLELLNAFMDAEMMSITYSLYALESNKKDQLVAKGRIGVTLLVEDGRYLLKTDTEQPFEQGVELRPQVRNVYFFDIDKEGKLRIFREGETGS